MHGKDNCNVPDIWDDSMFFDDDKLFELCEVFGEEEEQSHGQEVFLKIIVSMQIVMSAPGIQLDSKTGFLE